MAKAIELALLPSLETEMQFKARDLRNDKEVNQWMFTDHEIGANELLLWVNELKNSRTHCAFLVLDADQTELGLVTVDGIDLRNKRASWAYYLKGSVKAQLSADLEFAMIQFLFDKLKLEKINCEVIDEDDATISLHKQFGFLEQGIRPDEILKNGERKAVLSLGLSKSAWDSGRVAGDLGVHSISIEWDGEDYQPAPIDQIEAIRAKNNLNWMSILRIALEKSPSTAKPIVDEIKRMDREISSWTEKLTEE